MFLVEFTHIYLLVSLRIVSFCVYSCVQFLCQSLILLCCREYFEETFWYFFCIWVKRCYSGNTVMLQSMSFLSYNQVFGNHSVGWNLWKNLLHNPHRKFGTGDSAYILLCTLYRTHQHIVDQHGLQSVSEERTNLYALPDMSTCSFLGVSSHEK